jgi:hypothetical protein
LLAIATVSGTYVELEPEEEPEPETLSAFLGGITFAGAVFASAFFAEGSSTE